jgi:predicted 3-demethylubiquinone-9 3-methyltransferase (glyoxalase superfamily)
MKMAAHALTTCLWFDTEAEQAANFYVSIFQDGKIGRTARYPNEGQEIHGKEAGSVMTVEFEIAGHTFVGLNGGPHFKFNEAISLVVRCRDQQEVDYYWDRLTEGGDPRAQQCGWLKDRFGVSWQVVPDVVRELLTSSDSENAWKAMAAVLKMKKLDVAEIRRAAA